jgi:hypothetical protein
MDWKKGFVYLPFCLEWRVPFFWTFWGQVVFVWIGLEFCVWWATSAVKPSCFGDRNRCMLASYVFLGQTAIVESLSWHWQVPGALDAYTNKGVYARVCVRARLNPLASALHVIVYSVSRSLRSLYIYIYIYIYICWVIIGVRESATRRRHYVKEVPAIFILVSGGNIKATMHSGAFRPLRGRIIFELRRCYCWVTDGWCHPPLYGRLFVSSTRLVIKIEILL